MKCVGQHAHSLQQLHDESENNAGKHACVKPLIQIDVLTLMSPQLNPLLKLDTGDSFMTISLSLCFQGSYSCRKYIYINFLSASNAIHSVSHAAERFCYIIQLHMDKTSHVPPSYEGFTV